MISPRVALVACLLTVGVAIPAVVVAESASATTPKAPAEVHRPHTD